MFTQILSGLNWLHVFVAAIAYFALGAIWYSPLLFSKPWIKLTNVKVNDPAAKKAMGLMMFSSFVLMFLCSVGLSILYHIIPVLDAVHAIKFGLFFGVSFSLTSISISFIYERRPLGLHAIDAGYNILGITVASLVLVLWK
ncbi:MAG TPA: DUF1761 domain-containing protein [Panacibacter sp.]|nr:DUF1761 domain-containing protein [Panacibacter sp.]